MWLSVASSNDLMKDQIRAKHEVENLTFKTDLCGVTLLNRATKILIL